ncbi:MAG: HAMP domain-containing sensor histidine kinase [Clostridiales bacterium]|nr:HAMP domain-containing histidine kinase [Eubacteriales bacterium]MCI5765215.1 HAMP domain-containing histidine kinase [Clostridiales bacterium]MDD7122763.1 HAMP domain-containing sensor histidine kinase [Clostridiales bacterium]MDY5468352.1 HAMP domain-containing sensor histidine kinase [Eubacteriales bacterium]
MKSQKATPRGDNLRLYFIVCIFAILCVTLGVSALLTLLLEWLTNTHFTVPTIVWMVLFSVVLGGGLSIIMSRFFLRPVTRMGRAMERVAAGDFTVRLDNPGALGEMRDSYAHFNTMTRALAATETLQSDFISNVSHEFKTPINAIEGYAMLMQDAGNDPALQREYADKILLSTRRLSELVNNILLLSKVDNQTMPLEKHPYRLDEQLRRAILLLERKWTQKQIEWDVDMDEATYTGNESLMLHVWVNLLDNAIKFDPVGGEIRLRLHCESTCIRITVSDNGPGIPKDQQSAIFERFYQADGSHKSEGNGLGLALARRIVRMCGGEISVSSEPGKGSCFTVELPRE